MRPLVSVHRLEVGPLGIWAIVDAKFMAGGKVLHVWRHDTDLQVLLHKTRRPPYSNIDKSDHPCAPTQVVDNEGKVVTPGDDEKSGMALAHASRMFFVGYFILVSSMRGSYSSFSRVFLD